MGADAIPSHMELETLRDLYIHELKDLYSAEKQMVRNMPKMAKAAANKQLAAAYKQHLEPTKKQADPLEQIQKNLGETTRGQKSEGMKV
ncbi:MAG: ferritin-like protein, partial [Chthoniobacter sp.]|nr:ferritin-like protein [Chthoniobacter sp.]